MVDSETDDAKHNEVRKGEAPDLSLRSASEKLIEVLSNQKLSDFHSIAVLVCPNPPEWLSEHLGRWSRSVLMSNAVRQYQPNRAEMLEMLTKVGDAAALLIIALNEPSLRELMNAGRAVPMDMPIKFQAVLQELEVRARTASKLPTLSNADGKAKAGRGSALLEGEIVPEAGNAPLNRWRRYFNLAKSGDAQRYRSEYIENLRQAEHAARSIGEPL